jgi:hypothetical protein
MYGCSFTACSAALPHADESTRVATSVREEAGDGTSESAEEDHGQPASETRAQTAGKPPPGGAIR